MKTIEACRQFAHTEQLILTRARSAALTAHVHTMGRDSFLELCASVFDSVGGMVEERTAELFQMSQGELGDGEPIKLAPHMMERPAIFKDGDQWCVLLGENIQVGVCGFGKTPAEACAAFDKAWNEG